MPLYEADGSIDHYTLQKVPERFIIFYASITENDQMWCPECTAVDNLVRNTFSEDGPAALVVYVGNRMQWKSPLNIYRQEPWKITNVPTIVRLREVSTIFSVISCKLPVLPTWLCI
ncbi:hypothetical protein BYT27DRAFT_6604062 [Phlegmacium glaucopus]|nr:hypothetical protein BYT27DRAFT_6604062 [Phlegmacium glaucopus]